jgi:hypothetical protein
MTNTAYTPYHYTEWVSYWQKQPPVEVYRAVRGRSWDDCRHVREQAALTVCMDTLGEVLGAVGLEV